MFSYLFGEPHTQRAVLEDNLEVIQDVVQTAKPLLRMVNDWQLDPVELARYLGKEEVLNILSPAEKPQFLVQEKGKSSTSVISLEEMEKLFSFRYWPSLYFQSYSELKRVVRNCPYLLRPSLFGEELSLFGLTCRELIFSGYTPKCSVRWIDEKKGYGLFSERVIHPGEIVGEYTGCVRQLFRFRRDENPYCFHYPTKFWSRNYYVVDSQKVGNLTRFINHSHEPNLEPKYALDRGLLHMMFISSKKILKGKEMTFNYGYNPSL